jgi:hypothetical protein
VTSCASIVHLPRERDTQLTLVSQLTHTRTHTCGVHTFATHNHSEASQLAHTHTLAGFLTFIPSHVPHYSMIYFKLGGERRIFPKNDVVRHTDAHTAFPHAAACRTCVCVCVCVCVRVRGLCELLSAAVVLCFVVRRLLPNLIPHERYHKPQH